MNTKNKKSINNKYSIFLGGILVLALASTFAIQTVSAKNENGKGFGLLKERWNGIKSELKLNGRADIVQNARVRFIGPPIFVGEQTFKGEVLSISGGNTLVIKGKKDAQWTVNVESTDIVVNRNWEKINFSSIQVGDQLMVMGTVSSTGTSSNTVNAKVVRDLSIPPMQDKTLTGKVTAVSSTGFTLMVGDKSYTVTVNTGDILVNRIWDTIVLADITVGQKVSVFGQVSTTASVDAKLVRDLSLPVMGNE